MTKVLRCRLAIRCIQAGFSRRPRPVQPRPTSSPAPDSLAPAVRVGLPSMFGSAQEQALSHRHAGVAGPCSRGAELSTVDRHQECLHCMGVCRSTSRGSGAGPLAPDHPTPLPSHTATSACLYPLRGWVELSLAALCWSIARKSAPTVSICSRVNAGRCAHSTRHLRSRTRSASEKYGSSNSSSSDPPTPGCVPRSSVAIDHPLSTADPGSHHAAAANQVGRTNTDTGSPDHTNGVSTTEAIRASEV